MRKLLQATVVVCVLLAAAESAAAKPHTVARFVRIGAGFTQAVYVTSAPGDAATLYVVEQNGTIQIVRGGKAQGVFLDISKEVLDEGEHGLLSVAFSPGYTQNHLFYVDYTDLHGDTHVAEFHSQNGVGVVSSERELLFVKQPWPNHKGGQLQFDRAGRLYVGMGDGGTDDSQTHGDPQNHGQDTTSKLAKLLRIDPSAPDAQWQVVALGLRNPWRFSFDRKTGDLWLGDVGVDHYEEIDFRTPAQLEQLPNFGWSHFEGFFVYNPAISAPVAGTLVFPVTVYRHDDAGNCGIIGGYVYRGAAVAQARGHYYFGDLCTGSIWWVARSAKGKLTARSAQVSRVAGLSSFGQDGNGELYAVGLAGGLYKLKLVRVR
jgi:glucose/arabinose dehydrogenase